MKNLVLYLFIASLFISCDSGLECIRPSTTIVSETRDLKDFRGVAFSNIGDIYLTQGPEFSFKIEGPDNVVELTTTKIENELLVIGTSDCFNGEYELSVEITAPEYKFINFSGLGSLTTVGQLEGDILVMELMGVGEIEADIYVDTLITTISGNAIVNYTGNVTRHEFFSSGQFALNSYPLETDHTYIRITGIGDSYVTANETLEVIIEGTGDVHYQGNPVIDSEIIGSGKVIDSN